MEDDNQNNSTTSIVDQIDAFLGEHYSGEATDSQAESQFKHRSPRAIWRVRSAANNDFFVILPQDFPYSPPRIALPDTSKVLVWPHVEFDGALCALPIVTTVDAGLPEQSIKETLVAADKLIQDCINGSNADDFRKELLSYVEIAATGSSMDSLCAPEKPSRRISLWSRRTGDKIKTVAADTEYQLKSWLRNSGNLKPGKQPAFREALFLWLDQPPLPNEYPKSAKDIRILAEQVGAGELFHDFMRLVRHHEALIVIATEVEPGAAVFAARISKLSSSLTASVLNKRGGSQQSIDDALMSPERTAKLCLVTRQDASWVYGRDQNPATDRFQSSTVALIGCGSLGSTVAQQLADAGVSGFLLVDGDTLSAPNTARHFLGTEYLGHAKAPALAHALKRRHPRIRSAKSFSRPFQYTDDALMKEVFQSDLIIDCTGIWSCMASLHDLHKALERKPALLTAWFEPHAVSCLSVQSSPAGNGLRAGFDPDGIQWSSVSAWPNPARRWVSPDACSVLFSSYGASELAFHASHVAEHAIAILCDHNPDSAYVSIGAADKLSEMGGVWSEGWAKTNGGTEPGNRQLTSQWPLFDEVELDSA